MKVLVADDDLVSRGILESHLSYWRYVPVPVNDGREALALLKSAEAPPLAILDWMMPYMSGPEVCAAIRNLKGPSTPYVILVTLKADARDIVRGLRAGAQDYVTKPYDADELEARLGVAKKMVELQSALAERLGDLEEAERQIKKLGRLLPMCCRCKKVRADDGYWSEVEKYVAARSEAKFTHSFCPTCYGAALEEARREHAAGSL
jgi:DNA-binding response OmpR family regulator